MQMECLIKREGPTNLTLEKTKYTFWPIPGSKKGEPSTSVCEVTKEEHVQYLLRTGQFREYIQEQAIADAAVKVKSPLEGFSIEKYLDSGYVAVDKRNKEFKYCGPDGQWKKEKANINPFKTEIEAFQWLKEEAEFIPEGAESSDDLKTVVADLSKLADKGKTAATKKQ